MAAVKETRRNDAIGKGKPGPGRPKGSPNKVTRALKEAILEAAEAAGGKGGIVAYLTRQAKENPRAFLPLLGRILPIEVNSPNESLAPRPAVIQLVAQPVPKRPEEKEAET